MKPTIAIICSLILLPFPTLAVEKTSLTISQTINNSNCNIKAENGETGEYSQTQLKTLTSQITVQVIGDNNGGSGTLLAKKGNTYLVLTNSHVLRGVNSISLKTSNGKTYPAKIVPNTNFDKFDLALLQFQSNQNYCLLEIAQTVPNQNMPVMAVGYPSDKQEISFRTGIVKQISGRPLKEGYQIGYTSDIEQGMSGGAIVNSVGQLIGVNGRSAYPILNTGYVYPDGSRPSDAEIEQMRKLSWGIPITTFLAQVERPILVAYNLPLPKPIADVPTTQLTGWLGELEQKAQQITVRIDSSSQANGSGIIIAQEGDTYTVLTAAHVVCERQDATKPCGDYQYQIVTHDGKKYPVEKSTIKTEQGVDLGVLKFTARQQNYQVATLGNYSTGKDQYIFTAGYPKLGNNSPWRLTIGKVLERERGLLSIRTPVLFNTGNTSNFVESPIANTANSQIILPITNFLIGGYELVYSSITYGGMSGGPVLDAQGRVIGIHGLAEAETARDKTDCGVNSQCQVQLGRSLGIPINTFLALATRLGTTAKTVEKTKPPQLTKQQVDSVEKAILSVDVPIGNAPASQWLERGNQLWRLERYQEAIQAFDEVIKQKPSFVHLAYYGKGLALYNQSQYQEAITPLEQAVKLQPDYVAAWQILSLAYQNSKQFEPALVAINKAIQRQPKNPNLYNNKSLVLKDLERYKEAEAAINEAIKLSPLGAFYHSRGTLYFLQNQRDLALADFNRAIQINPNFAGSYLMRGIVYRNNPQDWKLALADYNRAMELDPQQGDTYILRGSLYRDQNQWDLALADYNRAIEIDPKNASFYYTRGFLYTRRKQFDLALADFNRAIDLDPKDTQAYSNRSLLYMYLGDLKLALADANRVIEIDPKSASFYANRSSLYLQQGQWNLALADVNRAIEISLKNPIGSYTPLLPHFYIQRADLYKLQGQWDLALADINRAIEINPQDARGYIDRGDFYKEQKKWDLALADFNRAIQINPQSADVYRSRADLYRKQKKWDLALADFNRVIEINPQDSSVYIARGDFYKEQEKWELALADFRQAIKISPQNRSAYTSRGSVYEKQEQWDLALADFNQAIKISPQNFLAYIYRAGFYKKQKKWELALADFNQVIKLNPQYSGVYLLRSYLYREQQEWELAEADLSKAIALNPEYVDAYFDRGIVYREQKKWDLALADFTKAIALNPQFANAYLNRGVVYLQQKKWELALADSTKALELNPQFAEAYFIRGAVYGQQKKWELAEADSTKAIELNPQFAEAYFIRGGVYHAQNKYTLALAEYNQALNKNENLLAAINNIGLIKYEQGATEKAIKQWQESIKLDNKLAEPHLALAVALYSQGEQEKAYQLAQIALQLDKTLADVKVLKDNLWGENLIADAQKLLSTPRVKDLLSQMR